MYIEFYCIYMYKFHRLRVACWRQTPHSDYFPWQYIISLPPAMFFAQIQADSFFIIIFCSGLIFSKYSIFPLKILNNHN